MQEANGRDLLNVKYGSGADCGVHGRPMKSKIM